MIWGALEARFKKDAALPYCDAATTVMSITAQYLQTKKRWENWVLWVVVDLVYTFYLFPQQHLTALATLYGLFTVMGVIGAVQWMKLVNPERRETLEAYDEAIQAQEA